MAFVIYNGKKLIPAPFVSISKEYVKAAGGSKITNHPDGVVKERQDNIIGSQYRISISGTLVASMMGSPQVDGTLYSGTEYPPGQSQPKAETTLDEPNLDKKRFKSIMFAQQSVRHLFAEDGYFLEIDDGLGNEAFKCIISNVESIEFSEAQRGENWTDRCEYTINLVADQMFLAGHPLCTEGEDDKDGGGKNNLPKDESENDIYLSEASENWSVEPQEEGSDENSPYTFLVTHSLSATGKRVYDGSGSVTSEAWEEAEKWIKTKIMAGGSGDPQSLTTNQQSIIALGTTGLNLSGYLPYNRMRTENVDELQGTFTVSETFLLSKENTIESFSLSSKTSAQSGLTSISIEGNVRGLDDQGDELDMYNKTDEPNIKYTNALAKFGAIVLYTRAQTFATSKGITLNPEVLSQNETHDKVGGTVNYSAEFDNRPTTCISGARTESINVQFTGGEDVFAIIPVIGRSNGPIMQDMNTVKEGKVTITIEALMNPATYGTNCNSMVNSVCTRPSTDSVLDDFREKAISCHTNGTGTHTFKESDNESFNVRTGRYTRSTTFVIKTC